MKHPCKPIERKTAAVGCKHTTKDLILGLDRCGFSIDACVTIAPETAERAKVADYYDLHPFLEANSIPYVTAEKYNLKTEKDRATLLALNLELLLVMG